MSNKRYSAEKMLYARLDDIIDIAPKNKIINYLGFLDEKEIMLCKTYLKKRKDLGYKFYGGHSNAVRNFVAVWTDGLESCEDEFPISGLTFYYSKNEKLSHRDFLGYFLHSGIAKESIGDILVGDGFTSVFLNNKVAGFALNETDKIGKTKVRVERELPDILPPAFNLEPLEILITSNRLDCIISAITSMSRSDAVNYINNAQVNVNFSECLKVTKQLGDGDILSLRGFGRFIFEGEIGKTKKNRMKILIKKYV